MLTELIIFWKKITSFETQYKTGLLCVCGGEGRLFIKDTLNQARNGSFDGITGWLGGAYNSSKSSYRDPRACRRASSSLRRKGFQRGLNVAQATQSARIAELYAGGRAERKGPARSEVAAPAGGLPRGSPTLLPGPPAGFIT